MNDLFGGVVYAGIDTDKHRYPIGKYYKYKILTISGCSLIEISQWKLKVLSECDDFVFFL